jgi:hypothetical protein
MQVAAAWAEAALEVIGCGFRCGSLEAGWAGAGADCAEGEGAICGAGRYCEADADDEVFGAGIVVWLCGGSLVTGR